MRPSCPLWEATLYCLGPSGAANVSALRSSEVAALRRFQMYWYNGTFERGQCNCLGAVSALWRVRLRRFYCTSISPRISLPLRSTATKLGSQVWKLFWTKIGHLNSLSIWYRTVLFWIDYLGFPSKMDRGLDLVYRGSDRGAAGA